MYICSMKDINKLRDDEDFAKTIIFKGKQVKKLEKERLKLNPAPSLINYILYKATR